MKARRIDDLDPTASLRENAARILHTRLDELLTFADEAMEPGAVEAQHDMRIATKRLRYVLEIAGFCFGSEAEAARGAAKELQSALGDVHDCDVMLPRAEGIDSLTALLRTRRELGFRRFCDLWEEQARDGVWVGLARALAQHA